MRKKSGPEDGGKGWLQFWGVVVTAVATIAAAYIGLYKPGHAHAKHTPSELFDPDSAYPRNLGPVQVGWSQDQLVKSIPSAVKIGDKEFDFKPTAPGIFNRVAWYLDANQSVSSIYYYFAVGDMHSVRTQASQSLGDPVAAKGQDYPANWDVNSTAIRLDVDSYGVGSLLLTADLH